MLASSMLEIFKHICSVLLTSRVYPWPQRLSLPSAEKIKEGHPSRFGGYGGGEEYEMGYGEVSEVTLVSFISLLSRGLLTSPAPPSSRTIESNIFPILLPFHPCSLLLSPARLSEPAPP